MSGERFTDETPEQFNEFNRWNSQQEDERINEEIKESEEKRKRDLGEQAWLNLKAEERQKEELKPVATGSGNLSDEAPMQHEVGIGEMKTSGPNLQKYVALFDELNEKESDIRARRSSGYPPSSQEGMGESHSSIDDFYKEKNQVALQFVKDINKKGISDKYNIIYRKSNSFYYDKIFVEYPGDNGKDNLFTILPIVVSEMEEDGAKSELFEFMRDHINWTFEPDNYYDNSCEPLMDITMLIPGPFCLSDDNNYLIFSGKQLAHEYNSMMSDIERFGDLIPEEEREKAIRWRESKNEELKQEMKSFMDTYLLSQEQAERLGDVLYDRKLSHYSCDENALEKLSEIIKAGYTELLSNRDDDNLLSQESLDAFMDADSNPEDITSLEKRIFDSCVDDESRHATLKTVRVRDDLLDTIIKEGEIKENASVFSYYLRLLSRNRYLTKNQALRILDTTSNAIDHEIPTIARNLFNGPLDNEEIAEELLTKGGYAKNYAIEYSRRIPDKYINSVIDSPETYEKDEYGRYTYRNIRELLFLLKNNQNMTADLLTKFNNYADTVASKYGLSFHALLILQDNISEEMMLSFAEHPMNNYVAINFLKRKEKPASVIEAFASSKSTLYREPIAKAAADGVIELKEETFRKLALDKDIPERIRMRMLFSPKFKDYLPTVDKESRLGIKTEEVSYGGGWGPTDFDNRGGEKRFTINSTTILKEHALTDSYGATAEERMWAKNAYTNFDYCTSDERFSNYCREHKEAILIIIANNEQYENFGSLIERVELIEQELSNNKNDIEQPAQ